MNGFSQLVLYSIFPLYLNNFNCPYFNQQARTALGLYAGKPGKRLVVEKRLARPPNCFF